MASNIRFLVPVDFSDQSLVALDQACRLASFYHADLNLIYVIEDLGPVSKLFVAKRSDEEFRRMAEESIQKLAKDTSEKYKIQINTILEKGKVYERIVDVADKTDSTMIIMATSNRTGLKKRFIGTTTLRVVQEANCPVITFKGTKHRPGCKNIVLPLDLSRGTTEKVEKAIEFEKVFKGAAIRVVSILKTTDRTIEEKLNHQLNQVRQKLEESGVSSTAELVKIVKGEDTFANAIIAYSRKVEGDVIMIMTQQEEEPIAFFLGSSAQSMITQSDIPVMSIVPKAKRAISVF